MLKLIIKINEDKKIETRDLISTGVNLEIKEIGRKASNSEIQVSSEIRKRINKNNFSVINLSKKQNEEAINELIEKLMFD